LFIGEIILLKQPSVSHVQQNEKGESTMKSLNLNLNLEGLNLSKEDSTKSAQQILSDVIQNVILGYGQQKQGLGEVDRRKFYKIQDALEVAIKEGKESVELEDDWMGFMKTAFREVKLMPNLLLRRVEEKVLVKE
jgi:hypothetical protein